MRPAQTLPGVDFRYAGLFDIPTVFSLITDACLNDGTFTETILTGNGYASLLVALFKSLQFVQRWRRGNANYHELFMVEKDGEAVGFLHCIHGRKSDGRPFIYIDSCAIADPHRNQGYGNRMIEWMLERESGKGTLITANCNRYAKAMQHIFKRHRFTRVSIGRGLDSYTLQPQAQCRADDVTAPPPDRARARPSFRSA